MSSTEVDPNPSNLISAFRTIPEKDEYNDGEEEKKNNNNDDDIEEYDDEYDDEEESED